MTDNVMDFTAYKAKAAKAVPKCVGEMMNDAPSFARRRRRARRKESVRDGAREA